MSRYEVLMKDQMSVTQHVGVKDLATKSVGR